MKENKSLQKIVAEHGTIRRPIIEAHHNTNIPGYATESEPAPNYHLRVVLKYKWFIILSVLVVTTATWFLLKRVQPLYEVSTTIKIDPENVDVLDNKAVFYQTWVDPEYFNTQIKLLTNPLLAKQVVEALALDQNKDFPQTRPTTLSGAISELISPAASAPPPDSNKPDSDKIADASVPANSEALENTIEELLGGLQVVPVPKTRLIRISYRHHNPELARKIANTVAEKFINNNLERRTGRSKSTSQFLQQRLAALQAEIRTGEEQLIDYGRSHEIVSLDAEQNTVVERLATLNRQLIEAEAVRKESEAIYKLTRGATSIDNVPEVLASTTVRVLQERLSSLKQKRAELLVTYKEEWPEVKQIEQTIAQVEKDLQAEKNKIVGGIETRYLASVERERLIKNSFNQQMGTTLKQNESAINYRIKQQEIETKKDLYKSILSQLKEADIASISDVNNISLTTAATLPKSSISPRVPITLSISIFFSLAGALGLVFIREYMNTKINTVEDVDRFVNLPTLGLIPEFKPEFVSRSIIDLLSAGGLEDKSAPPPTVNDETNITALSAFKIPNSAVAEAYRHLRTSMILAPGIQNSKLILVTSGQPGEGKTTTAVNLAIAMAHTGARTLLIDADLRKPSLHNFFKVENEYGLSQYLSGYAQMEDIFNKTNIPNLSFITSSGKMLPLYPAELLGSPKMRELLDYLSATRDCVIIDSPPILPFADGVILSSMVDGVLLVVNAENSHRDVVRRARRILNEVGANLFGVVLNNMNSEKTSYGGYYRYGYKYQQGSDENIFQRAVSTIRNFGGRSHADKQKDDGVGEYLKVEIKTAMKEQPDDTSDSASADSEQPVTVSASVGTNGLGARERTRRKKRQSEDE